MRPARYPISSGSAASTVTSPASAGPSSILAKAASAMARRPPSPTAIALPASWIVVALTSSRTGPRRMAMLFISIDGPSVPSPWFKRTR